MVPCQWGKEKTRKFDIKQLDEGYVTVLKGLAEVIPLNQLWDYEAGISSVDFVLTKLCRSTHQFRNPSTVVI